MTLKGSAKVKPGFSPREARDIVKMNREASIGEDKTIQTLARKYKRDPAYLAARKWVWQQRMEGHSIEHIAAISQDEFGEKITMPRVEAMVVSGAIDMTDPDAQRMRALDNARLDWYLTCLRNRIAAGDDKAINTALRIAERRARMYGYDAPTKVHAHLSADVDPTVLDLVADARDTQRQELLGQSPAYPGGIYDADVVEEETDEIDDEDGYADTDLGDEDEL